MLKQPEIDQDDHDEFTPDEIVRIKNSHFPDTLRDNLRAAKKEARRAKHFSSSSDGGDSKLGSPVGSASDNTYESVAEARMSAAQRLWNAEQKQRAKSDASLARTPSSIPKPEPKPEPQEKQVTKELKTGPAAHFTPKDAHVKRGQFVGGESKKKGADGKACWDNYRYNGTENGKDKCVKVSEDVENIMAALIDKIIVNEATTGRNK